MIDYIIQTLKFNHCPIYVKGKGDVKNLLNWNVSYRTFDASEYKNITTYPEIVFYFPLNPILIQQYRILTALDVFPVEWTLSISNDGNHYTEIDHQNKEICSHEYQNKTNFPQVSCIINELTVFQLKEMFHMQNI